MGELWCRFSAWFHGLTLDQRIGLASLLVAIVALYFPWRDSLKKRKSKQLNHKFAPDLRLRLLEKVQKYRVEPRLRQGLREAIRIDLGLTELPSAVPAKLREYAVLESGSLQEQPLAGPIEEIFESAGRQLLILGDAGTGKTNLLLELAQKLIERSRREPQLPIPVVFSLPRWTLQRDSFLRLRPLKLWLQDDLVAEYNVSPAAAKELLDEDHILPLLDGLDEVAQEHREHCVREIHAFQKDRDLGPLAVCCRLADFESLHTKLDVAIAIRVEKLDIDDVKREISKPGLEYVRRAMDDDPELWKIVDTPLWLHVLFGAAQVAPAEDDEDSNPRDRLFARYVDYALARTAIDSPRSRTERAPLLHWLGTLAGWMKKANQGELIYRDLDLLWTLAKQKTWIPGLFTWLLIGVLAVTIAGREVGSAVALGYTVLSTTSPGIWQAYFSSRRARTGEIVIISAALNGIAYGISAGMVWMFSASPYMGFVIGLRFGFVAAVCAAITAAFWPLQNRLFRMDPQAFRSLRYTLLGAFIMLTPLLLFSLIQRGPLTRQFVQLATSLTVPFTISYLVSFFTGHYLALFSLWIQGKLPIRYEKFLDEAVERLFLIRRGDSYEFIHITFRDYIARVHGPR